MRRGCNMTASFVDTWVIPRCHACRGSDILGGTRPDESPAYNIIRGAIVA